MTDNTEKKLSQFSDLAEEIKLEVKNTRECLVDFFKKMNNEEKFETFCYAVLDENKEVCKILLDSGFDINHHCDRETAFDTDGHEQTVLTVLTGYTDKPRKKIAVSNKIITPQMAQWLIDNGADVNESNICEEETPLYIACENNQVELAEVYLKNDSIITKDIIELVESDKKDIKPSLLRLILQKACNIEKE